MFGWHISFEHHFYKSVRNEYSVRLWRKVKYVKPEKKPAPEVPGDAGYQVNP